MKLQAQFEAIDTDHSGYITRSELKRAMKGQGLLTKSEINDFIEAADSNRDGKISLEEWMDAVANDMDQTTKALVRTNIRHVKPLAPLI